MKYLILLALITTALVFLLPVALSLGRPYPDIPEAAVPSPAAVTPTATPVPTAAPVPSADDAVTVSLLLEGSVTELSMEDYLFGVVAAEMPVSFEPEALRAQAAAARTTTLYHMTGSPHPAHPEADICANAACCEAYLTESALRAAWGEEYESLAAKIREAVAATDGCVVTYDSAPALCVFHSASAGLTESSAAVWGGTLPYLVSVESPESAETVPGYVTTVVFPIGEFRDILLAHCPDADLSGLPIDWLGSVTTTDGGRVAEITIGGVHIAGTTIRSLYSLRSAAFSLELTDDEARFTVTGYGHGVGMSQYGAELMARDGATWQEILAWYYPGTELGNIGDFPA